VNDELVFGRKQSWPNLRYYPSNNLEGLRKTIKTLVRIDSLLAKIVTWDRSNTEQDC
jgi:hypothetical protein